MENTTGNSYYERLKSIAEDDPEEFPYRVSRCNQRKSESKEDWIERALQYVLDNDPPDPKKKNKTSSSTRPLDKFSEEELEEISSYFPGDDIDWEWYEKDPTLTSDNLRHPSNKKDSFLHVGKSLRSCRSEMFKWVLNTYDRKSSEAECSLDCLKKCTAAMTINCMVHNHESLDIKHLLLEITE